MDKLTKYREIVKNTILKYALLKPFHGNIELHPVFDETSFFSRPYLTKISGILDLSKNDDFYTVKQPSCLYFWS